MAFDIEGARKAGYSDAEIADHLAQQANFNAGQARKAGYSDAEIVQHLVGAAPKPQKAGAGGGTVENLVMGGLRGVKDVIDTGADWLASGFDKLAGTKEGERVRAMNTAGKEDFERRYGDSTGAKVGRVGGQIVATLPVGGALAAPVKAAAAYGVAPRVLAPVANAIATSGMRAGGATGAAGLAARTVGGAVAGGASAGLVDPDSAGTGAVVGAVMPGALNVAGATVRGAAGLVRPFFQAGQERIVADVLKQYTHDPKAALAALKTALEVVPGSAPTTAAAAGDVGLAGLQRTLANASGDFAAELTQRGTAQNTARTAALEAIAGNPGKISAAQEARDAATSAMREAALARAGKLDASAITAGIERMLSDPNNAGATTRAGLLRALNQVRDISGDSGVIDARALYEIRKDIGLAMNGKLSGDAGNLRYARGALDRVQGLFDDAIEAASQRTAAPAATADGAPGTALAVRNQVPMRRGAGVAAPAAGGELAPLGLTPAGARAGAAGPAATGWRDYLAKYAELSKPINQMEALQDVLKRVQTGTTDTQGGLLLSAARLNQILKNEGQQLAKQLTPEQLQTLRNIAADLNAQTLAMNAGRATGSNTVQNLAQDRLLRSALGSVGASQPVQTTLGALLKLPYVRANQQIQQRLGDALLDPREAARLLEQTQPGMVPLSSLLNPAAAVAHRTVPLLAANPR